MSKKDEAALIVCHPEGLEYLKAHTVGEFLPTHNFVITEAIYPRYAFVISRDEFIDWVENHGQGWKMPDSEKGDN